MKKRVIFVLAIFIINSITFTGCWNYREMTELSIIAGLAIDKNEQGKYLLTSEIVDLHQGGKDPKITPNVIESYGDTITDASKNLLTIVSPRLYWGQLEVVIISREVAQEGIIDVLDSLSRFNEARPTIDVLVSKEKTAKEMLDAQTIELELASYNIKKLLDSYSYLSKIPRTKVYESIKALSGEGISPVLPAIRLTENHGKKTMELSGSAVFDKDKLMGFLDGDETRSLLFVRDKIKGGQLIAKEPPGSGHPILTLDIKENKTKVKPLYSNGKVFMNIEIKTEVNLIEYDIKKNLMDENGYLILKHDAEETLKADIENVIRKVQKDYDTDIFGFGNTVYRNMPSLWKEIKPDWNDVFRSMDVNVRVNLDIRNSGLISKPIEAGG